MKVHSDIISKPEVMAAASAARSHHNQDIYVEEIIRCGSRSRKYGTTFYAESMNGKRARNGRPGRAASWTAYGYLIAELFAQDPYAIIGTYRGAGDFIDQCRSYVPRGESLDFLKVIV